MPDGDRCTWQELLDRAKKFQADNGAVLPYWVREGGHHYILLNRDGVNFWAKGIELERSDGPQLLELSHRELTLAEVAARKSTRASSTPRRCTCRSTACTPTRTT
jgi:hypothetical protein